MPEEGLRDESRNPLSLFKILKNIENPRKVMATVGWLRRRQGYGGQVSGRPVRLRSGQEGPHLFPISTNLRFVKKSQSRSLW